MTFFRISYNLTGKWNLDIDFFKVLTYCNFPDFGLIEQCYWDNQQRFMSTIRNQYWDFFKNTKNVLIFTFLVRCGLLANLSLLFRLRKVPQSLIQSDNSIKSYMPHMAYYYYYYRQTDTFVKTVFSDSRSLNMLMKISNVIFHIKLIPSHS